VNTPGAGTRALAARAVAGVLARGQTLEDSLAIVLPGASSLPDRDRSQVRALAFGAIRHHHRHQALLKLLLDRPLKGSDRLLEALLSVGLFQLAGKDYPDHAAVSATVAAAQALDQPRVAGLINATLRRYQRESTALLTTLEGDPAAWYSHPPWLVAQLRTDWPDQWRQILAANQAHPPLWLRVNLLRTRVDDYLDRLAAEGLRAVALTGFPAALRLDTPVPVSRLPGFADGLVSVQDAASQFAAPLLAPEPGMRVLDACAAPGGKAAHLLECSDLDLLALDLKASRCRRVEENFQRLQLQGTVRVADCLDLAQWWDGKPFDAVLADVPCTASGVVRRHPDAKWLRRPDDILSFARTQQRILSALSQVVRPGGKLLYATCSLFPPENHQQIARFLAETSTAIQCHEELLLPDAEHDGFYYCLLQKTA